MEPRDIDRIAGDCSSRITLLAASRFIGHPNISTSAVVVVSLRLVIRCYVPCGLETPNEFVQTVIASLDHRPQLKFLDEAKKELREFSRRVCYLITDQLSTFSRDILEGAPGTHSFGRLNVTLCGDLDRFPKGALLPCQHRQRLR